MRRHTPLAAVAFVLAAHAAGAAGIAFDESWKHQRFSLFSANDYDYEGDTLTVESEGTASLTYRALDQSLWTATEASWDWSVTEGVPPTDLTRKGGDDRNLAVYFVFLPEDQAQEMQGAPARELLQSDVVRVLIYVWGGEHERDAVLPSAYLGETGKTVVLRPSGTGTHAETVDLSADYARAFEGTPGALVGVAVSGDSDDTETRIEGSVANLVVE